MEGRKTRPQFQSLTPLEASFLRPICGRRDIDSSAEKSLGRVAGLTTIPVE